VTAVPIVVAYFAAFTVFFYGVWSHDPLTFALCLGIAFVCFFVPLYWWLHTWSSRQAQASARLSGVLCRVAPSCGCNRCRDGRRC
jgi:hypothetical protein